MRTNKRPKKYPAPHGSLIYFTSILFTALLAFIGYALYTEYSGEHHLIVSSIPGAIWLFALLQKITGYKVKGKYLYVCRLLWSTRVNVSTLKKIRVDSSAMNATYRFIGNPGLFSFAGIFWSERHGRYKAYVTNFTAQVIIRLKKGGVIIISPDEPEEFLEALRLATREDS